MNVKTQICAIAILLMSIKLTAQNNKEIVIKRMSSIDKNSKYLSVFINAYDATTKQKLIPIVRIDKVAISICDTSAVKIYVSKGTHKLQVGWIGYKYTKWVRFKSSSSEDYEITCY
ncbi:MAG: hypothetical protein H7101_10970, partial [Deinococcales bacterium]|nr:hypothetical protein [Chitinophagaceae bacterium]